MASRETACGCEDDRLAHAQTSDESAQATLVGKDHACEHATGQPAQTAGDQYGQPCLAEWQSDIQATEVGIVAEYAE